MSRQLGNLTNNHLVRQRLDTLEKLFGALVDEFAGGDISRIERVATSICRGT